MYDFAHMDHHRNLVAAVWTKFGINLPLYTLTPMPVGRGADNTLWLQLHQQSHQQLDALLGIAFTDMTDGDFSSPDAMGGWIRQNAALHQAEGLALGVD